MKKYIFALIGVLVVPCVISVFICWICPEMSIGQGEHSLKNCRMGKEVLVELDGLYKGMDVEEYTLGILSGVIAPDYDMEVLKMQAVLVRTNLLREMEEKGTTAAEDISYDYISVEERKEMWGQRNYDKWERRMERAVVETAGYVLKKEGSLIIACYHAVSIGTTSGAKEILGEDISYLQPVESSRDVEAKYYMNLIVYTPEEIKECIRQYGNTKKDGEDSAQQEEEGTDAGEQESGQESENVETVEIHIEESTENGFVRTIKVGESVYTGEEAMKIFELPSLNFYVEQVEEGIRFVCLGKGNNLGVSQYGANSMAKEGKTMEEILQYYYKDVTLTEYKTGK